MCSPRCGAGAVLKIIEYLRLELAARRGRPQRRTQDWTGLECVGRAVFLLTNNVRRSCYEIYLRTLIGLTMIKRSMAQRFSRTQGEAPRSLTKNKHGRQMTFIESITQEKV